MRKLLTGTQLSPGKGIEFHSLGSFVVLLLTLALLACQGGEIKPAEIGDSDNCSHCRMAISEKRFAVQFVGHDREAVKFDDAKCMAKFITNRKNRDQIAAFFVADYETKEWVRGENATFVQSGEIRSPMGGGFAAFKDAARANEAAARLKGRVMKLAEVLGESK